MKTYGVVQSVRNGIIEVKVEKWNIKSGEIVTIHWGKQRTVSQNALYWKYLTYLVDEHLKEQGFFCPESLHESLRAHFLDTKEMTEGEFKSIERTSTTELNAKEFMDYFDKVDNFVVSFFEVNTAPFWAEYGDTYAK